ncbi:Hsp20/alpha crystallin family protein [Spirosoma rhododendri]|uniref:Hsp20/alpha crystallin family protein n=1 Tax=Spirosoma rhododendri TaxID=2728024 RepID=A0A7L5DS60_9BACT|nr:Hsp20/alpha crystallin family protein [Spirosoma rhododendri]QJD78777.1 Hsp20/alpha crystallin family protein [Spirosoma rhododendri]
MSTLVRYNRIPTFFNPFNAAADFGRPIVSRYQNTMPSVPAVNVKETEAAFEVALAAPGLKKEDLKVSVLKDQLTIAYKSENKTDETTEKFTRQEFSTSQFERSFRLPKNVDAEQIKASYTDGILTIELPKVAVKEAEVKEIVIG